MHDLGGATVSDEYGLDVPADRPDRLADWTGRAAQGWKIVRLPIDIDIANAGQVTADLLAAASPAATTVLGDMTATAFCDCAGVSALLTAGRGLKLAGGDLRIVATARPVLRTFELTGLPHALPVYPSISAALDGRGFLTGQLRQNVACISHRRRAGLGGSVLRPGQPQCP